MLEGSVFIVFKEQFTKIKMYFQQCFDYQLFEHECYLKKIYNPTLVIIFVDHTYYL